ncbi:hypothetical protein T4D_1967 [Trichinella pseudospiralis]|uniref:Uncharacterized protein n=1 Tax=Trichinella pseudospiralis TaxID=6337 RepID=A0A0V1FIM4_TRIPS|nr:hypothetical protein T4D_1967 [Trichinella pseudospiralis]
MRSVNIHNTIIRKKVKVWIRCVQVQIHDVHKRRTNCPKIESKINICFEIRESSPYVVDHFFHFTHFIAFGQKKLLSGRLKIVGFYASRSLLISFERLLGEKQKYFSKPGERPTTIQRLLVKSCDLPKSNIKKYSLIIIMKHFKINELRKFSIIIVHKIGMMRDDYFCSFETFHNVSFNFGLLGVLIRCCRSVWKFAILLFIEVIELLNWSEIEKTFPLLV